MTVMIATPHAGLIDPLWLDAYLALTDQARADGIETVRASVYRQEVAVARNALVQFALDPATPIGPRAPGTPPPAEQYKHVKDITHILWLDDDTCPPADALTRLLRHNVDIVSGFYVTRVWPYAPAVCQQTSERNGYPIYEPMSRFQPDIQAVDGVGFGCVLIRREVFEVLPAPWFQFVCSPEGVSATAGEDMFFCTRVRKGGYKIHLDFDVQCGHLARQIVGWNETLRAAREMAAAQQETPAPPVQPVLSPRAAARVARETQRRSRRAG